MSRIRKLEVSNFRCLREFSWTPDPGINCIVGPGDSGKSTILDAIDLCMGLRRGVQLSDADFFQLSIDEPIRIALTLGELDDSLKNLDAYGLYLRGFDSSTGETVPEPEVDCETVLTLELVVQKDLEPIWGLFSERAAAQNLSRTLSWTERTRLACSRLGAFGDYDLSWRRGSVLNRVSEERAEATGELASVARTARKAFGDTAKSQVEGTLEIVKQAASDLGISVGEVTALLDSQSISLSGATISLHDGDGVPLRALGLGSTRLLITGLQRKAAGKSSIVLVDEIEHGLEPHRIMRLVASLGAKESTPPLQVFMTTHSPVALRELSASQLHILRRGTKHQILSVGTQSNLQATVRACPEAFLSNAVIVCEGASEIGFVRGLDLYRVSKGKPSIAAKGVALADGHGETTFKRANAFITLGYRTMVLRDNDKDPDAVELTEFTKGKGTVLQWQNKHALEEELFASLSESAVLELLEQGVENMGEDLIDAQIKSVSNNSLTLEKCREGVTPEVRQVLGTASKQNSKTKKVGWFKSISAFETVGRRIVGPDHPNCDPKLRKIINQLFTWVNNAEE
jgi:putative ATP-dependent endonuclease of OLD family